MPSTLLLINAGSSSLKLTICLSSTAESVASGMVDWSGSEAKSRVAYRDVDRKRTVLARDAATALQELLPEILQGVPSGCGIEAVGHRIVHGGELASGVVIDDRVMAQLEQLSVLAPLHNPPSLAAANAARAAFPNIPHIAAFDTAFHRTILPEAAHYAVPQRWSADWGIKRYGFHGLSYAYCAPRAAELLQRPTSELRLIICHLGHGCSAAAVQGGKCLDTTMGFTPLEGLMMATRCGTIDAEVVVHLQRQHSLSADEISTILNRNSGLLGVSGVSADMREVLAAADDGNSLAQLAVNLFCYRVRQAISALMVPLGGADALVFTAGIGENSPRIREQICRGISFLGFTLDQERNSAARPDAEVSSTSSLKQILVIGTREDVAMAREVRTVLERIKNLRSGHDDHRKGGGRDAVH